MKIKSILVAGLSLLSLGAFTSCEDMMNITSKLVMFSDDNKLDQPTDSVYSVMGIIGKMQSIADQTVLLGEIRGDLVELTPQASVDLQELAQFKAGKDNIYNAAEKYYAVINNCNFYLARVDTSLKKRNEYVFMREFAAVKTFRAWTYMQLAAIYGKVPFITQPVLTEAEANKNYPMYGFDELCTYFVNDLAPYTNIPEPGYGGINGLDSKKFFLPTLAVLGDLCLWAERYQDAAAYYHEYLTTQNKVITTDMVQVGWSNQSSTFNNSSDSYTPAFETTNTELISYIPMESITAEAGFSDLGNVFNSTIQNNYFNQVTPSRKLVELSKSQLNCIVYTVNSKSDTLFSPERNYAKPAYIGDLRLPYVYRVMNNTAAQNGNTTDNPTSTTLYSSTRQTIAKYSSGHVSTYRRGQIYLRFAEAMNRAGFPESAFAILKYGLTSTTINKYISAAERASAGNLLTFSPYAFTSSNTMGIHSRGAGDTPANKYYVIPTKNNKADSIDYVEDLICNETALETAFEGYRFFDLVRMATHRNSTTWLADKIAGRKGSANYDADLYSTLSEKKNWFLPLK